MNTVNETELRQESGALRRGERVEQCRRLIVLDRHDEMRPLVVDQERGVGPLRVHGVGGDGAALEREGIEEGPELGDLVGLFRDLLLGQDETAESEKGGEEVEGLAGLRRASPHGLAVDGHRLEGTGATIRSRLVRNPGRDGPLRDRAGWPEAAP